MGVNGGEEDEEDKLRCRSSSESLFPSIFLLDLRQTQKDKLLASTKNEVLSI